MEHSFFSMDDELEIDAKTSRSENILHSEIAQYEEAEKCCMQLISEFLHSYELDSTLTNFVTECSAFGYVVPFTTRKERIKKESLLKILEHFSQKDQNNFFDAWEMLVPSSIKEKLEYKKLTFYLHIYFAVLPLRKQIGASLDSNLSIHSDSKCSDSNAEQNEAEDMSAEKSITAADNSEQPEATGQIEETDHSHGMEALRNFLETKGTEFSAETEFLPYYALPFVSDPASHPSFQELFTFYFQESWMSQLESSLREFVVDQSWGKVVAPQILKLVLESRCDSTRGSHSRFLEAHNFKKLKQRYQKLQKDHHNLIGIAAELTGALENSVKGQVVDLKATLNNCSNIFPDLFNLSLGTEVQPEAPAEDIVSRSVVQSHEFRVGLTFDLDFNKIKQHLSRGSVKTKLLLFQALRWRVTRSSPEDRGGAVGLYFRHDVLSLHHSNPQPSSLLGGRCESPTQLPLPAYFNPTHALTPHPLQQAAARFINTLASLRCGRDYLCSAGSKVLRVLVSCLQGDKSVKVDSVTTDMILAALQKLSLRHSQRVGMIEVGLVEWLILHLSANANSMKDYTLEYSSALLMNLCLHRRAKERCVPFAETVLKLLMELLGSKVVQAIPYVNGTLYSLLAHPQLNHEAKRLRLCGVLEFYLKNCDGEMRKQLEYILKLHRGDCQPDHTSASDEENADDDTEEVDLLEEELDSDDPVRGLHCDLSGDQLLYRQYRLVFPYHGIVHPSSSSVTQPVRDKLLRPATPRRGSLGPLRAKCPTTRPATSTECGHPESRREELSETCPKTSNLASLELEDDDAVVCDRKNACGSCADCDPNDSKSLCITDSSPKEVAAVSPSQPSAVSQDG
ncbi:lisH domain-containing protein ARMC9-like isoform X3 [Zootermopsis nevadensis]|nr:lisH domain-containing protein ARMC9-like isoform X3 [Zootermopsis nevadensis]